MTNKEKKNLTMMSADEMKMFQPYVCIIKDKTTGADKVIVIQKGLENQLYRAVAVDKATTQNISFRKCKPMTTKHLMRIAQGCDLIKYIK